MSLSRCSKYEVICKVSYNELRYFIFFLVEGKSPRNDITSWAVIGGLVVIIILLIAGLVWQCRRRGK